MSAQPPAPQRPYSIADLQFARARQLQLQEREARIQARRISRLTVALGMGFNDVPVAVLGEGPDVKQHLEVIGAALGVGFRMNFMRWMGVEAKVNGLLGRAEVPSYVGVGLKGTTMRELFVDAGLHLNAGRAYLGPTVTFAHRSFGDETLTISSQTTYDLREESPFHTGLGAQLGFLLGARERFDLNARVHMVLPDKQLQLLVTAGYHFLLEDL